MAVATQSFAIGRAPLGRAVVAIVTAVLLWELGSRSSQWLGYSLPWVGVLPSPSNSLLVWAKLIRDPGYWFSWVVTFKHVLAGFFTAVLIGVPLGLVLALNKTLFRIVFPVFEILRPIPPLAWVPASIIFWPTTTLSIVFVTFIGAFYTIVINVIGGAAAVDQRFIEAARSMGASFGQVFRRIIFPGVLPSIIVGCTVGLGITWEVVVAAEMISGGSSTKGGASGGLGHFIWASYLGGSYEQIVVGMASIGIAGYATSAAVRKIGAWLTPWSQVRA